MNVPANFMATLLFSFWIAFDMQHKHIEEKMSKNEACRMLSAPRFAQMDM